MHDRIRRLVQIRRVGISAARVAAADLQHELALWGELQQLVIPYRLQPGQFSRRAIVAAQPDKSLRVDMDAMLPLRPFVAGAGPAPRLNEIACRVEHEDRRRGH
jgi:hypothetical protein